MNWINQLNDAIAYIEEHLTDEIEYEELGRIACCSSFHFQRMFTYMAGVTLSEYIRRRKMSLAAEDLKIGEKVIDVSLKYGYQSPTSFNRVFQSIHGISPTVARDESSQIKSFPPLRFQMTIKGEESMNYRIVNKGSIRIVGVSQPLEKDIEQNFNVVPQMWGKAAMDGTIQKLASMINTDCKGLLGVSVCNDEEQWKYYIAVATTLECTEPFEEYEIPSATWAVFSGKGTGNDIQTLEKRIVTEWLPNSGYEYANLPDVEVYLDPNPMNATFEVWIPVVRK